MKVLTRARGFALFLIILACLAANGCGTQPRGEATGTPGDGDAAMTLSETRVTEYRVTDFDSVHTLMAGGADGYLLFGGIPVAAPAADTPAGLTRLMGRWEGYSIGGPVNKDRKVVLVVAELSRREARLFGWSGTNLQFPEVVGEVRARVMAGEPPGLEWEITWPDGVRQLDRYTYDRGRDMIVGVSKLAESGRVFAAYELTRQRTFSIYKDYPGYLAGKSISVKSYRNEKLRQFGPGYMLYLPPGYDTESAKRWPLLLFLHGYGDRGSNILVLAKASPFMMVREKGPLPLIIVAPLLDRSSRYASFPDQYMGGVLDEVLAGYRVDPKRVYATGLSMGGEATYRLALSRPGAFAAIAPLSAFWTSSTSGFGLIKDLPVRAIHGANDSLFPVARGRQPVDAIRSAGGNAELIVLANHDHDTWTDTYSDPAFYDWLLAHRSQ